MQLIGVKITSTASTPTFPFGLRLRNLALNLSATHDGAVHGGKGSLSLVGARVRNESEVLAGVLSVRHPTVFAKCSFQLKAGGFCSHEVDVKSIAINV